MQNWLSLLLEVESIFEPAFRSLFWLWSY